MKKSAGILVFRKIENRFELLLVHPGGPFWEKKDINSWSIPKGEFSDDENPFSAAKREFIEETSFNIYGNFIELEAVKQPSGKIIFTWAVEGEIDITKIRSNNFSLEWPPKSGKFQYYPEIDKAAWFTFEEAKHKISKGQIPIIEKLAHKLNINIAV
jgi:predicted NUDIX family NTP pyrophosphohydrolase